MLTFEQTGQYFRHTLLVSFAYQAFNIASFNRITPAIFTEAKTHDIAHLRRRVLREYLKTLIGVPLLLLTAWGADVVTGGVWSERFHLSLWLMALLLFGFMLRALADFPALIMNGRHEERHVLHRQVVAFVVGGLLLAGLTWRFGLWGAACATVVTNALYAALNWQVLSRLPAAPVRAGSPLPTEPGAPL
ncbi:MAG: hypothetical protein EON85_08975 [Brevundimonas sp.]|nr:MAG: hypothetical protein EON85_08975 [Brevundimonas sp.]